MRDLARPLQHEPLDVREYVLLKGAVSVFLTAGAPTQGPKVGSSGGTGLLEKGRRTPRHTPEAPRGPVLLRQCPIPAYGRLPPDAVLQIVEEVLLAVEAGVEGAHGRSGTGDDGLNGQACNPLLLENLQRCAHDSLQRAP